MYGTLAIPQRALNTLAEYVGDDEIDELRTLAQPRRGRGGRGAAPAYRRRRARG